MPQRTGGPTGCFPPPVIKPRGTTSPRVTAHEASPDGGLPFYRATAAASRCFDGRPLPPAAAAAASSSKHYHSHPHEHTIPPPPSKQAKCLRHSTINPPLALDACLLHCAAMHRASCVAMTQVMLRRHAHPHPPACTLPHHNTPSLCSTQTLHVSPIPER